MLEGGSTITSSGSGGAPGSPGFRRLEEVVEGGDTEVSPHFCNDGSVSELVTSEVEGLRSPSGWNSKVELCENVDRRSVVVVLGELRLLSDGELEAPAVVK